MFTTVNGLRDLLTPSVKCLALLLFCFGYFRVEMEWASPLEFIESHALPIPPWSDHTLNMHLSHEIYSQPETLPNLIKSNVDLHASPKTTINGPSQSHNSPLNSVGNHLINAEGMLA